jgi:hypothetical protein
MDVFSTELGIRLSFVKTSEFQGGLGVGFEHPNPALGTPLIVKTVYCILSKKCNYCLRLKKCINVQNIRVSKELYV